MSTQYTTLKPYSETSGTPTNYNSWASWINYCLASFGWKQTTDTGAQLAQWFGGTVTGVTNISGNTWRYTFSGGITGTASNTAPQVGNAMVISGFTSASAGNNGTFVITSLAGGSNTFDVVNATGTSNISDGTGVITLNTNYTTSSASTFPPANAANTALWEVWTSTDALISEYPFYVKLWYGMYSANTPCVWIQLGNGTDGAGNLTGYTTVAYYTEGSTNSSSVAYPCYAAGSTGWFSFALWDAATPLPLIFSVERSKDNAGNDTSTYSHIVQLGYSSRTRQQALFAPNSVYGTAGQCETGGLLTALPITSTTFSYGGTTGVGPIWPEIGALGNPCMGVLAILQPDFTDQIPFSIIREDGEVHTYLPITPDSGAIANLSPTPSTSYGRLAIRYE